MGNELFLSPGSVVATVEIIYYSLNFPGAMSLYGAFYDNRRIGPYEVALFEFTSTDGKIVVSDFVIMV